MSGLIAALTGVVLATFGVFLFFSNRILQKRGFSGELIAITLLISGGAILLTNYTLIYNPNAGSPEVGFDPNALMESAPPAAVTPVSPESQAFLANLQDIGLLVWGTPSDQDSAKISEEQLFTNQLGGLFQKVVSGVAPQARISLHELNRQEYQMIDNSPSLVGNWCERLNVQIILMLEVNASLMGSGEYALWREPVYRAHDCRSGKAFFRSGRVVERGRDRFPYETALASGLTTLLDELGQP